MDKILPPKHLHAPGAEGVLFGLYLAKYDWVLPPLMYTDLDELISLLDDWIIGPAKAKQKELRERKQTSSLRQAGLGRAKEMVFRATGPTGRGSTT